MGIFNSVVGWDRPGAPLLLTAIEMYGALKALVLPGREQFVAGNTSASGYNNFNEPEACRVIANPKLFSPNSYSVWVETRVSVDGPGEYFDQVSFGRVGTLNAADTKKIVEEFRARNKPGDAEKMLPST